MTKVTSLIFLVILAGDQELMSVGDKVVVTASLHDFEKLQRRRGLWQPDMNNVRSKITITKYVLHLPCIMGVTYLQTLSFEILIFIHEMVEITKFSYNSIKDLIFLILKTKYAKQILQFFPVTVPNDPYQKCFQSCTKKIIIILYSDSHNLWEIACKVYLCCAT